MLTIVLSGPASMRHHVLRVLGQTGAVIEDTDHPQGFTPEPEESFVTLHYGDLNLILAGIEPFAWRLRSHFAKAAPWARVGDAMSEDRAQAADELARLKASLRAQGIKVD